MQQEGGPERKEEAGGRRKKKTRKFLAGLPLAGVSNFRWAD